MKQTKLILAATKKDTQRLSSPTGPSCSGCRKPMVLEGKRPMPSTNLVEATYRCEICGTTTKRIVKEP